MGIWLSQKPYQTWFSISDYFTSVKAFHGLGEFALVTVMEAESFPSVCVYIAMVWMRPSFLGYTVQLVLPCRSKSVPLVFWASVLLIRSVLHQHSSPASLWLEKVLLAEHSSDSGGSSSIQPEFRVPCFLVTAQSNILINFPVSCMIFRLPSSLMNCFPNLSSIPTTYSTLCCVQLKNK